MMANRLACTDSRIKAMVSVAGPLVNGTADHDLETFACTRRVPVLHFHGTNDTISPFDGCSKAHGGPTCQFLLRNLGKAVADTFPAVPDYIETWRIRNGQSK